MEAAAEAMELDVSPTSLCGKEPDKEIHVEEMAEGLALTGQQEITPLYMPICSHQKIEIQLKHQVSRLYLDKSHHGAQQTEQSHV